MHVRRYFAGIDKQAGEIFSGLAKSLAGRGRNRNAQTVNQRLWIGRMAGMRSGAAETVNADLAFAECRQGDGVKCRPVLYSPNKLKPLHLKQFRDFVGGFRHSPAENHTSIHPYSV